MKITLERDILNAAIANVIRAVSAKSPIPALEGILVKAEGDTVQLSGFDLEMGITTQIAATVEEPGAIVLSAKLFSDIVRRLPDALLHIDTDEKNLATLRCGRSGYTLMGIPAVEFPAMPMPEGGAALSFPQYLLKDMIAQTRYAVAASDAMPVHKGSLFELCDGVFNLVSVDGCRLAMREEPYPVEKPVRFIVPGKALSDLEKMLSDDPENEEKVSAFVSSKHIVFELGSYRMIARLLEGNFLDYRNAIPKTQKTTVTLNTRAFLEAVERASLVVEDRLKNPLRCKFSGNTVTVSVNTAMGHAEDCVDCKIDGDDVEIGFNPGFLLEAIKNTGCDEITLLLSGPLAPMKVLPSEGSHFTFLVLPMRIRS